MKEISGKNDIMEVNFSKTLLLSKLQVLFTTKILQMQNSSP